MAICAHGGINGIVAAINVAKARGGMAAAAALAAYLNEVAYAVATYHGIMPS